MHSTTSVEPLHVLDLPQIYTRPSYEELLLALTSLQISLPSWASEKEDTTQLEDSKAVATYLTQIVSNGLKWLSNDDEREHIYEIASKRLSERSGRTGMSAITRTFQIPSTSSCPQIELEIHEPPLTGDNLGLKTWASSYLLAKRLEPIGKKHLRSLLEEPKELRGLELGSGTGVVGLAAAAVWKCYMHLTDLPDIVPNLALNADRNRKTVESRGGRLTTAVHDWEDPPPLVGPGFQVVLAADPLYSPNHATMLTRNIAQFLSSDSKARAIIELPMRDKATEAMHQDLKNLMKEAQFELLEDDFESGFDDWEEHGERAVVRCWWGVFGRKMGK